MGHLLLILLLQLFVGANIPVLAVPAKLHMDVSTVVRSCY